MDPLLSIPITVLSSDARLSKMKIYIMPRSTWMRPIAQGAKLSRHTYSIALKQCTRKSYFDDMHKTTLRLSLSVLTAPGLFGSSKCFSLPLGIRCFQILGLE